MAKSRHAKQIARNKRRQASALLQTSGEDRDLIADESLLLADLEPQHEVSQHDVEVLLLGKDKEEITDEVVQYLVEQGWPKQSILSAKASGFFFSRSRGSLIKPDIELGSIYEARKDEIKIHVLTT